MRQRHREIHDDDDNNDCDGYHTMILTTTTMATAMTTTRTRKGLVATWGVDNAREAPLLDEETQREILLEAL